jgi:hypothetical protein
MYLLNLVPVNISTAVLVIVLGYGGGGDVGDGSVGGPGGTFGEKRGPRTVGRPR